MAKMNKCDGRGIGPNAVASQQNITTTVPEAETTISAYAGGGGLWLAAVSDFSQRGGFNTTKYAYSLNNGGTWSQQFMPISAGKVATSDGRLWEANSDPVAAFGPTNRAVYLANLYFNGSNNANGLYVAAGTLPTSTGQIVWPTSQIRPVVVNPSPSATNFEDKEWITVDPVTGYVYVVWTRFVGSSDMILFSRSLNAGQTWSAPTQVSPSGQNGGVQGAQVAADRNGNVWVVWTVFFQNNLRRIFASKSVNRGVSFATVGVAVSPYYNALTFPSNYRKESFPTLAVQGVSGTVHVAFPASSQAGTSKILYQRAVNGTLPFSNPVNIINTTAGNQFFPAISVDPANASRVQLVWFDSRNNTLAGNRQLDIYAALSTNSGASFATNVRVTPTSIDVGNTSFVGDYMGVASQSGISLPAWAFWVTPMRTATIT